MTAPFYVALVHYPVRARDGAAITSAITNVDVHDIARSSTTFGARGYFVVSPIEAQRVLVDRILDHWKDGAGARRVPERKVALSAVHPIESLEAAAAFVAKEHGERPRIVVTEARAELGLPSRTFSEVRRALESGPPALLCFGTAHGLHESVLRAADLVVEPIEGVGTYNHLSVRAAAAIVMDRLFGR